MIEATLWATLAAASLLVGAVMTFAFHPSRHLVGLVMAFGAGAMISAVSFDLVLEASKEVSFPGLALGMAVGAVSFFAGSRLIRRRGDADGEGGGGLSIVLGAALDGVPESIVLALSVLLGGSVSVSFLAATLISNIPEAIAATSDLEEAGWTRRRILLLWTAVVVVSGGAAALGYAGFAHAQGATGALVQAFAAGAVLTMLADSMMPEAFEQGGDLAGLCTVAGFAAAVAVGSFS